MCKLHYCFVLTVILSSFASVHNTLAIRIPFFIYEIFCCYVLLINEMFVLLNLTNYAPPLPIIRVSRLHIQKQ